MKEKRISQNTIIILCWLIYSMAYLGRYSYNANITLIIDSYGVTKAQAGLVATFFFFAYGVGQVINGILSSRYNKRILFPTVLLVSSAINLALYFGAPFFSIKYLWLINGFAQSCLWSGIVSVISKTVDDAHLGRAMLLLSTTTCVGTIAAYSSSSLFAFLNNFRLAFLFGAAVMTLLGVIWFCVYGKDLEIYRMEKEKENTGGRKGAMRGFIVLMMFLGFVSVIHNIVKDGLTTWVPEILKDRYGLPDSLSILLTVVLPILGIFGALISLKLNKYIKNFLLLISLLFAVSTVGIAFIAGVPAMNVVLAVILFGVVVCMMHGINNVVTSFAPLKLRDVVDSGKMAGILNGCCYAGSTVSSYALGKIADVGGWQTVLNILVILSLCSIVVGIIGSRFGRNEK
ncbi:MAG: MFS transporter [Clostridia bacterium]|nr:MFS transporter [Clostridia bacterium]